MTIQDRSSLPQRTKMEKRKKSSAGDMQQQYIQQDGLRLERSILEINDAWQELESDPGLFSLLCDDLVGANKVDVQEILEINADLRGQVGDGHVYGFILLFNYHNNRSQRSFDRELETRFVRDPAVVNDMFFSAQKVNNACATYASLSILLNSQNLPLGDLLTKFQGFTQGMTSDAKGYAVGNSVELAAFHNRRAPVVPAYSSVGGTTAASGSAARSSGRNQVTRTVVQQYHFVPYLPINGFLMELDGMKNFPICHGSVAPDEDWMEKCRLVIQERMTETASAGHFTLLAIRQCHRTTCIAEIYTVQTQLKQRLGIVQSRKDALLDELQYPLKNAAEFSEFFEAVEYRQRLTELSSDAAKVSWTDLPIGTRDMSAMYEALAKSTNEVLGGPVQDQLPKTHEETEVAVVDQKVPDGRSAGQVIALGGVTGELAQEKERLKSLEQRAAGSRLGSESTTVSDVKSTSERVSPSVSLNFSLDASTSAASTSEALTDESNDSNEAAKDGREDTKSRAGSRKQVKDVPRSVSFSHAPHTRGEGATRFESQLEGYALSTDIKMDNLHEMVKSAKLFLDGQKSTKKTAASKRSSSKAQQIKAEPPLIQPRPVSPSGNAGTVNTSPAPIEATAPTRRRSSRTQLPKVTSLTHKKVKEKPAKPVIEAPKTSVASVASSVIPDAEEPESEGGICIMTSKRKSFSRPAIEKPVIGKLMTKKDGRLVFKVGAKTSNGPKVKVTKQSSTTPTRRSSRNNVVSVTTPILYGGAKTPATKLPLPSNAVESAVTPAEKTVDGAATDEASGRLTRSRKRSLDHLAVAMEIVTAVEKTEAEEVKTVSTRSTKKRKFESRSESREEIMINKEKEVLKCNIKRLEKIQDCLQQIVTALDECIPLEKERVRIYKKIIEENERKKSIQADAEDREFDYEPYISLMIRRTLELNLLTPEDRKDFVPKECWKFLDNPPEGASTSVEKPTTSSAKRPRKKR